MVDRVNEPDNQLHNEQLDPEAREVSDRREFLRSLGKWSSAAIAAIVLIESSAAREVPGSANHRGSWANGSAWLNSGTKPINRSATRIDGGSINHGGGGWLNSRGGGGSWVNRRGW